LNVAGDLERAFAEAAKERADAVYIEGAPRIFSRRAEVAALALKHRLPSSYTNGEFVDVGGLMAYAPSVANSFREAARFVDRILKGAKPGDLPVEQPTKYELVINLKTARALGLTMPHSLLLRADRVIE
jgi:putative ABC transport system substrate-binding protein